MMKKIIIASTIFLLVILLAIFLLTLPKNQTKENGSPQITPTTVPIAINQVKTAAQSLAPYDDPNFKFTFNESTNQFNVDLKTADGKEKFNNWATAHNISGVINNPDLIVYNQLPNGSVTGVPGQNSVLPTPTGTIAQFENKVLDFFQLMDDLRNAGKGAANVNSNSSNPNPTATTKPGASSTPTNSNNGFRYVYYGQCGSLGDIPLPDGCNLCKAGCGATTVAMIASSYLGNNFNPKTIVDLYKKNGYYLGCDGSSYTDAKSVLEQLGLKTTSYISFRTGDASEAAPDFKKYLDGGWTIFTLANYCDAGCGHYFWVTQVNGGNILAYDPYYGQNSSPPFSENSKSPFPKYRIAFGVKK